ncbi:MAG: hypothetical protein GY896_22975 [Gammaproteobacteria bacterium]|nr:hypothetical protein [Gammaproteobacteria bacterium]
MGNYAENRKVMGLLSGGLSFSAVVNPAAIAAGAVAHEAFTVDGIKDGDIVIGFVANETANVAIAYARVSDNDEITVTFMGGVGGGDPAISTWTFYVIRPEQPGPGLS